MKITLTDIIGYYEDERAIEGDASREGYGAVKRQVAEEWERKVEENEWEGLPFTCEADTEDEAIELYNEEYCRYDYIKAAEADFVAEDLPDDERGYCATCRYCGGVDDERDICVCEMNDPHADWKHNDNEPCPQWRRC
jgi:hypothetical protein